jgi:hypothetical protein
MTCEICHNFVSIKGEGVDGCIVSPPDYDGRIDKRRITYIHLSCIHNAEKQYVAQQAGLITNKANQTQKDRNENAD